MPDAGGGPDAPLNLQAKIDQGVLQMGSLLGAMVRETFIDGVHQGMEAAAIIADRLSSYCAVAPLDRADVALFIRDQIRLQALQVEVPAP